MTWWAALGLGFLGGAVAEIVGLHDLRQRAPKEWPTYYRLRSYWAITFVVAQMGGGLAVLYNADQPLSAILAPNVGASAPLIVRQLTRAGPTIESGTTG